ncbi:MAG: hypothetical protein JST42_14530, partial [Bacteroidetes bacterium]|nr:hypothetical protein [Bacteroidota bacterium]
MKVVAACCVALLLASASCNKNTKGSSSQSLLGTWELRASQSSMLPLTTLPPGNGNLLTFTDHSYSIG